MNPTFDPVLARDRAGAPLATPPIAFARARRHPARVADRRLLLASCIGAALPAAVATVRALVDGRLPLGDRGIIAVRAYDVFTTRTPLLGQWSASSGVTHHNTYSPGPMLYWLLAVPVRIGPPAVTLTLGALSIACVVGIVLLARRRGGVWLAAAVAVAVALMSLSLGAQTFTDSLNPSVALLPFALLVFLSWSIACGDHRLLPLAVVVASFAVQCHLTYLPPSAALLTIGVGGLILTRRSAGRSSQPRLWPWFAGTAALLSAFWVAPLIEQLTNYPGNLRLIGRAAIKPKSTMGFGTGWSAVAHTLGLPPWWFTPMREPFQDRLGDVTSTPNLLQAGSALAVLGMLVWVAVLAVRRRAHDLAVAAVIALVLCVALAGVAASNPTNRVMRLSLGYTVWWGSPLGMWAWLVLGLAAVRFSSLGARLAAITRRPAAAAIAGCTALAVGAVVGLAQPRDNYRAEYVSAHAMLRALAPRLQHARHTIVIGGGPGSWAAFEYKGAIQYELRRRGFRPVAVGATARLGTYYEAHKTWPHDTIYVWDGRPATHPGTLVAQFPMAGARGGAVTVTFVRGRPAAARTAGRPPARPTVR